MLSEYNNQTILTINNAEPATDQFAVKRRNSLRKIDEKENIKKWFECRDFCRDRTDCAFYDYDKKKEKCILYRREPYKSIKDLSLKNCTEFCSKDDMCDYLSHSQNNKCMLFSRENNKGKSSIGNLWVDYAIYGYNTDKGFYAKDFYECKDKLGDDKDFTFFTPQNYCIPKKFTNPSLGNTTIFFNKIPLDKYEILNDYIGLKSKNRDKIDRYKYLFLIIIFIILFYLFYRFTTFFD
jgi:PAN domain